MSRIFKFFRFFSPKRGRVAGSCALIVFCLVGCHADPVVNQPQAINDYADIIQVPEGGMVDGQRVHEGLFMSNRKINLEVRRITNALNKKLMPVDEQESDRLWEAR